MERAEAFQIIRDRLSDTDKRTRDQDEAVQRELFLAGLALLEDFMNQLGSCAYSLDRIADTLQTNRS